MCGVWACVWHVVCGSVYSVRACVCVLYGVCCVVSYMVCGSMCVMCYVGLYVLCVRWCVIPYVVCVQKVSGVPITFHPIPLRQGLSLKLL